MAKAESAKPKARPTGKKKPAAKDEKPQPERFIETARMLGADESGKVFEDIFTRLAKTKPRR